MTGVSDAVRGPRKAVLTCGGDVLDPADIADAHEIAVVRGTALPVDSDFAYEGKRMPKYAHATDVLYEADLLADPGLAAVRWEQAKAVAAALNAASGEVS